MSSISRNGTGDYSCNFSSALADQYFTVEGSSQLTYNSSAWLDHAVVPYTFSSSVGRVRVGYGANTYNDEPYVAVLFMR
jgi:hypothetical protein